MAYKFPRLLKHGRSKQYECDITILTRNERNVPASGFCNALRGIEAIAFDDVKRDVCEMRVQELRSVDAFFKATDGTYYFMEFKKSDKTSLDTLAFEKARPVDPKTKRPVTCSYIEFSLTQKAFDSLAIAGMTVLQNVPVADIMNNAVFIVVRLGNAPTSFDELASRITSLATGGDPVFWGLNKLKKNGFFRGVHTWTETEFVPWAKKHLK